MSDNGEERPKIPLASMGIVALVVLLGLLFAGRILGTENKPPYGETSIITDDLISVIKTAVIQTLTAQPAYYATLTNFPSHTDLPMFTTFTPGGTMPTPMPNTPTPTPDDYEFQVPDATSLMEIQNSSAMREFLSYIAYTFPVSMSFDETVKVDMVINPSLSEPDLLTQVVEHSTYPTSTAASLDLITERGSKLNTGSSEIEVTQLVKAVLVSQEPDAFNIDQINGDKIQPIDPSNTTIWTWSVTAKQGGKKHLILVVSRLVKVDGNDFWLEVESYRKEIPVKVTVIQRVSSMDWKWGAAFLVTLITAILVPLWSYLRKKPERGTPPPKKKYHS